MHSLVSLLLHQSLTNGILEALSFTATGTLRAAKNSSPPHRHANTSYYPLIGLISRLHPPCTLVRHWQGIAVGEALIPLVYQQLVPSCHTAMMAPFHCANHSSVHWSKFGIIHKISSNNTRSKSLKITNSMCKIRLSLYYHSFQVFNKRVAHRHKIVPVNLKKKQFCLTSIIKEEAQKGHLILLLYRTIFPNFYLFNKGLRSRYNCVYISIRNSLAHLSSCYKLSDIIQIPVPFYSWPQHLQDPFFWPFDGEYEEKPFATQLKFGSPSI